MRRRAALQVDRLVSQLFSDSGQLADTLAAKRHALARNDRNSKRVLDSILPR